MDSGLQIDNVQSFFKVIGNHESLWTLLLGRDIIHFVRGRAKVNAVNNKSSEIVIYSSYTKNGSHFFRYNKEKLIQEFGEIDPPLSMKEIIGFGEINLLLSWEEIIELIQTGKAEKLEAEKQEIEKQEAENREAERLETERRTQEAQRREAERLEAERRTQEAQRREVEKQALLSSLKEQFEKNFFNAHNFYHTKCTEHISFYKYQSEKINYVQSWVQCHLNFKPDHEQAAAIGAVEGHVQVVARAGSGKTSTLVNRALFLQKHCGIAPSEMLLLAFNRKGKQWKQLNLTPLSITALLRFPLSTVMIGKAKVSALFFWKITTLKIHQ